MLVSRSLVILFSLLLAGCATKFDQFAEEKGIKSVKVDETVFFSGPPRFGQPIYGPLPFRIADSIALSVHAQKINKLTNAMASADIHIEEILKRRAADLLAQELGMTIATNQADATLSLTVLEHGFTSAMLTKEIPFLYVEGKLHKNGRIFWRRAGRADANTDVRKKGFKWEEYLSDPQSMRPLWEEQIDSVLRQILDLKRR